MSFFQFHKSFLVTLGLRVHGRLLEVGHALFVTLAEWKVLRLCNCAQEGKNTKEQLTHWGFGSEAGIRPAPSFTVKN